MTKSSQVKSDKKIAISLAIERFVNNNPGVTYLEACVMYAEQEDIDISDMKKYISDSLKQKIHVEAVRNNTVKGSPDTKSLNDFF